MGVNSSGHSHSLMFYMTTCLASFSHVYFSLSVCHLQLSVAFSVVFVCLWHWVCLSPPALCRLSLCVSDWFPLCPFSLSVFVFFFSLLSLFGSFLDHSVTLSISDTFSVCI